MRPNFRRLFFVEIGLASIAGFGALFTLIFPRWIEFVSSCDPDQQNGSIERSIVAGLFGVAVATFALAALHRRARATSL
jgi:hypothetical protein